MSHIYKVQRVGEIYGEIIKTSKLEQIIKIIGKKLERNVLGKKITGKKRK